MELVPFAGLTRLQCLGQSETRPGLLALDFFLPACSLLHRDGRISVFVQPLLVGSCKSAQWFLCCDLLKVPDCCKVQRW